MERTFRVREVHRVEEVYQYAKNPIFAACLRSRCLLYRHKSARKLFDIATSCLTVTFFFD